MMVGFELHENGIPTRYLYFGELAWSQGGMGIDFDFPKVHNLAAWYDNLNRKTPYHAAATLGGLCTYWEVLEGSDADALHKIVSSTLFQSFVDTWMDQSGAVFREPAFLDGMFGRFSPSGNLGCPEQDDADNRPEWSWQEGAIKLVFDNEGHPDELRDRIFIAADLETQFTADLKAVVELFNPSL